MDTVKVGVIGCGTISSIYLKNCTQIFTNLEVAACADIYPEKAVEKAREYGIPKGCSPDELLSDNAIEVVLNLTIPKVHQDVSLKVLAAGKHVYSEKPLGISRTDGQSILTAAQSHDRRVGCAPDTFLGGGLQTCRKLIDDGWIGNPVAAAAFMMSHGPESWHPNPDFLYAVGAGPLFDMGPYYLTALITLLGPVASVSGIAKASFAERTITGPLRYGEKIKVEAPTHITGLVNFASGVVGTLITSFDVWRTRMPFIEIHGSEGSIVVPDPNTFGGPVLISRHDQKDWTEMPLTHGFTENSRGIGLADMAVAIRSGRPHRVNGELAYHVLDVMNGFCDASNEGRCVKIESTCQRPAPLPMSLSRYFQDK
jgi:predicted dehydrogenase